MQVVINIDEEDYNFIQVADGSNYSVTTHLYKAVYEGIPLPKHHGRLIDADALVTKGDVTESYLNIFAPTIIEADKETDDYYRGAQEEY